jgi:DNA repair protein RadD
VIQLRDFQQDVERRIYAAWQDGARNVLAALPTGAGKTVLFSKIMADQQRPSVAIAHRQELVGQISLALARNGVRHRIIGPRSVARACASLHLAETRRNYIDPTSPRAVAGVDTLVRMPSEPWMNQIGLWVTDECFPAGTLVDGRPIETLRVGDTVTAFDDDGGVFLQRPITQVFKNPAPKQMVRLTVGHHVIECTMGHPFLTRRGWMPAVLLTAYDEVIQYDAVPRMQDPFPTNEDRKDILLQGVPIQMAGPTVIGDNGTNKQEVRFCPDDKEQSDAPRGNEDESLRNATGDRAQAVSTRGERRFFNQGRNDLLPDVAAPRVRSQHINSYWYAEGVGVSGALQTGRSEPCGENRGRDRRVKPQATEQTSAGCEENQVPQWVRVAGVEIYERSSNVRPDDGFIYNIEVDELHTYTANGIVVHNCHHLLAGNKWGKAAGMFPNAHGLGVTATPCRADGRGLGRHADGLIDAMVVGLPMRALIDDGWLSEYRIFVPPSDLHLEDVAISAGGDYSPVPLRAAVHKSHITGDVVAHYQRIAPGKLGVTFAVDVAAATEIAQAFRAAGVPAEVVSADTPDALRAHVLRRFRAREVLQLVNVDLFGEGFDLPALEVVSMARPTQSYALYAQQFGRALRIMDGKDRAIIIDHVGNVLRHGLPDAPRVWTLDRRERRSRGVSDLPPLRVCLSCTGAYDRVLAACPYCGEAWVPAERSTPAQVDGDLSELSPEALLRLRGEIDRPLVVPYGAPPEVVGAVRRSYRERQEAQQALRDAMKVWAGRHSTATDAGTVSALQRRFYLEHGIDVLSAQALGRREADELRGRLS